MVEFKIAANARPLLLFQNSPAGFAGSSVYACTCLHTSSLLPCEALCVCCVVCMLVRMLRLESCLEILPLERFTLSTLHFILQVLLSKFVCADPTAPAEPADAVHAEGADPGQARRLAHGSGQGRGARPRMDIHLQWCSPFHALHCIVLARRCC